MDTKELTQIVIDWAAVFMRLSMHDFNHYARGAGLSIMQMNILLHLFYKGPCEVMEFTRLTQVSPAAASQMIQRMAQQGMVRRSESPDDRRVRLIHLTEQGQQAVLESIAARRQWIDGLVAGLDESQREAVAHTLQTLTEKAAQLEIQQELLDGSKR